jgi:hypothetical protein
MLEFAGAALPVSIWLEKNSTVPYFCPYFGVFGPYFMAIFCNFLSIFFAVLVIMREKGSADSARN